MLALVLGTRPEAVKLWPIALKLRQRGIPFRIYSTNQQPHLLGPLLQELGLEVEQLGAAGGMEQFLGEAIRNLGLAFRREQPELVIVHGDTASALAGALAAFYQQVPIAHVEAGLRTYDLANPFPEEGNRQLIARVASLHFCPTAAARVALCAESACPQSVSPARTESPFWPHSRLVSENFMTGNVVVDALQLIRGGIGYSASTEPPEILVTLHRRETWPSIAAVAQAIGGLTRRYQVRWVHHANPALRENIRAALAETQIEFVEPLGYAAFIGQLAAARIVLTDSGGVTEEAVTLGTPCIILRNETERTEALDAGHGMVRIDDELHKLEAVVEHMLAPNQAPGRTNVFGDGRAAERIVQAIEEFLYR